MIAPGPDQKDIRPAGLATAVSPHRRSFRGRRRYWPDPSGNYPVTHSPDSHRETTPVSCPAGWTPTQTCTGYLATISNCSSREMCMCLEPDIYSCIPPPRSRPSKGSGNTDFISRSQANHSLLHQESSVQVSNSEVRRRLSSLQSERRSRPDTHYRIFETEPPAGKIRLRGNFAMELYKRNVYSGCPEEQKGKRYSKAVSRADHADIITHQSVAEEDSFNGKQLNSRRCHANVNKTMTDFLTWRGPRTRAEAIQRYTTKQVTHKLGTQGLLMWHSDEETSAEQTDTRFGNSTKALRGIASARKLADYNGCGIFSVRADTAAQRWFTPAPK